MPGAVVGGIDGCRAGWVLVTVRAVSRRLPRRLAPGGWRCRPSSPARSESGWSATWPSWATTSTRAAWPRPPSTSPSACPCADRGRPTSKRGGSWGRGATRCSRLRRGACLGARTYEEACARSQSGQRQGDLAPALQHPPQDPRGRHGAVPVPPAPPGRDVPRAEPHLHFGRAHGASQNTAEGRVERMEALGSVFGTSVVARHAACPPAGARADDVLDAFAGAWTALRVASGTHLRLGGERDERGLRMEVVA